MSLPENLRRALGRLIEDGCPKSLVDRAMAMEFESDGPFDFTGYWCVHWFPHLKELHFEREVRMNIDENQIGPLVVTLKEDGTICTYLMGFGNIIIPGAAS